MATKHLAHIDLNKNELQNAKIHPLAVDPTPAAGDKGYLIYNTASNQLKVWNGTSFDTAVITWPLRSTVTAGANAGAPDYSFSGDTNTGIYSSAADTLNLSVGGVSNFSIASNAYTLGASGGTPNLTLDAGAGTQSATLTLTGRNAGVAAASTLTANAAGIVTLATASGAGNALIINGGASATNVLIAQISASAVANITNFGQFQNAITAGATGNAPGTPSFSWGADSDTGIYSSAANTLDFATGGTNRLSISSAGVLTLNSAKITGVADPTVSSDVVTLNYFNANSSVSWKTACRVGTTGSETSITIAAGAATQIAGTTVDGVTVAIGDRILVKNAPAATGAGSGATTGSTQPANGIYRCTANTTNLTITRDSDAASSPQIKAGLRTHVSEGTVNSDAEFVLTTNDPITLNTTALTFSTREYSELGSVSVPSFSFLGDSNTGMYSSAADTIDFTAGGVRMLSLNASNNIFTNGLLAVDPMTGTAGSTLTLTGRNAGVPTSATISVIAGGSVTYDTGALATTQNFNIFGSSRLQISNTAITVGSVPITGVSDPSGATDVATKNYVDNLAAGIDARPSVRAATTGAETSITIASGAATTIAGTTVDGITVAINDRILVKNAPAATGAAVAGATSSNPANGLYRVTANTTNLTITRAVDMDTWAEVPNAYVWVEQGTVNADSGWVSTADTGGTLNTTAIPWSKFVAAGVKSVGYFTTLLGTVTGGTGLTITAATHGLTSASRALQVQVIDETGVTGATAGDVVYPDINVATTGTVTITFAQSFVANSFRVNVVGATQ